MSKKVIGFTCSCFDLLHPGHVLMLEEARENCDILVVGLQVDPTLDRPEKNKPIQSITERHIMLRSIKFVDSIFMYSTEADLVELLRIVRPSIRFLGDDYRNKDYTGMDLGIPVHYIARQHTMSTTSLRGRVFCAVAAAAAADAADGAPKLTTVRFTPVSVEPAPGEPAYGPLK